MERGIIVAMLRCRRRKPGIEPRGRAVAGRQIGPSEEPNDCSIASIDCRCGHRRYDGCRRDSPRQGCPAPGPTAGRSGRALPSGTIIQPTTTIIPDGTGHVRVIIIPRRRSYLDLGTEVSVGDRSFRDYVVALGAILAGPIGSMDRTFSGPDASRCQARSTALGSIRTHRFRA